MRGLEAEMPAEAKQQQQQTEELKEELDQALTALDDAPEWLQVLPIENSDRVMSRRVSEAVEEASGSSAVFVDATGGDHRMTIE